MTEAENRFARHGEQLRDPAQALGDMADQAVIDPALLEYHVEGPFWETLQRLGQTLLISREYEHFVVALSTHDNGEPCVTTLRLPHPSGIAYHPGSQSVFIAATRKPNQIYQFSPVDRVIDRLDAEAVDPSLALQPLIPQAIRVYPGCLYIHDLAFIGDVLHANAVGENAVVALEADGSYKRVWWPECIEADDGPVFGQNYLQLNSIAAGDDLASTFFSASCDELGPTRPGDADFPVDGRGVIFAGDTCAVVCRGLTRPHSARFHHNQVWVDNSGYGQLCRVEGEQPTVVAELPGWTRGLAFCDDVALVGTSRVIPRFAQYAPGLDLEKSQCGIHLVDTQSGDTIASLLWPHGNQIFAIEPIPSSVTRGFPVPYDAGHDVYYHFHSPHFSDD